MSNFIKNLVEEDKFNKLNRSSQLEKKIDNIAEKQDTMQESLDRMEDMLLSHIEREKDIFQQLTSSLSDLGDALSGKKDDREK